jgi:hypothetical protein
MWRLLQFRLLRGPSPQIIAMPARKTASICNDDKVAYSPGTAYALGSGFCFGHYGTQRCECVHLLAPLLIKAVRVFWMFLVPQGSAARHHRNGRKVIDRRRGAH